MAKGQHLSKHQQGIVRRFYEHKGGIHVTKLLEITSDLAVNTDEKAGAKLWARAREYMEKLGVEPATIEKIAGTKNLKALGELVGKLSA